MAAFYVFIALSVYTLAYIASCKRISSLFEWGIEPGTKITNADYDLHVLCPTGTKYVFLPGAILDAICRGAWRSVSLWDGERRISLSYWHGFNWENVENRSPSIQQQRAEQ